MIRGDLYNVNVAASFGTNKNFFVKNERESTSDLSFVKPMTSTRFYLLYAILTH